MPNHDNIRFPCLMKKIPLLGIALDAVTISEAVEQARRGGLILAPSGPGLCDLTFDAGYCAALRHADLNLPDSGLAILLMRLLGMGSLPRTSGLGFLEALLELPDTRASGACFWVMPSHESMERNLAWLRTRGMSVSEADCHIAPFYPKCGQVRDKPLLQTLCGRRPCYIFLCTGSGTQEKLGHWLVQSLPYRPAVCCIGAAIGFLSGDQTRIPSWADRLCLGWFLRCLSNPRKFLPRYAKATRLIWLILRYRGSAPPMCISGKTAKEQRAF